jgi:hypothetical protein
MAVFNPNFFGIVSRLSISISRISKGMDIDIMKKKLRINVLWVIEFLESLTNTADKAQALANRRILSKPMFLNLKLKLGNI